MSRNWRWLLVLGYPLLIVNLLVAVLYAAIWCRAYSWKFHEGCLTFLSKRTMFGHPGGQGWSPIIGFADEGQRQRADLRVHEYSHVVQEMWFALVGLVAGLIVLQVTASPVWTTVCLLSGGPLFAVAYGLSYAYQYVKYKQWHDAYKHILFEVQAYEIQDKYRQAPDDAWGSSSL